MIILEYILSLIIGFTIGVGLKILYNILYIKYGKIYNERDKNK